MNIQEKRFGNMPKRKGLIVEKWQAEKQAIKDSKKVLLDLDSSGDNMSLSKNEGDLKNGFGCPDCGNELEDLANSGILESFPAQKEVICKCGFHGTRYVTD